MTEITEVTEGKPINLLQNRAIYNILCRAVRNMYVAISYYRRETAFDEHH